MLASDPHLNLTLPSIWYIMHLNSPTQNVMGVTIPGAPGIIIGFNNDIAWGLTNGQDDVMDWYDIYFNDQVVEATHQAEFLLNLHLVKKPSLFHGVFRDTITVTIIDI